MKLDRERCKKIESPFYFSGLRSSEAVLGCLILRSARIASGQTDRPSTVTLSRHVRRGLKMRG